MPANNIIKKQIKYVGKYSYAVCWYKDGTVLIYLNPNWIKAFI